MTNQPETNYLLQNIFDLERPTLHNDNIDVIHDGLELIFNNNYTFRV